jgi:hypothetical protein
MHLHHSRWFEAFYPAALRSLRINNPKHHAVIAWHDGTMALHVAKPSRKLVAAASAKAMQQMEVKAAREVFAALKFGETVSKASARAFAQALDDELTKELGR